MKKLILLLLIFSITNLLSQTVDFDTDGNWTAGSGALNSYQSDHVYSTTVSGFNVTFSGGEALREIAGTQDGFSKTFGDYSWRLRNVNNVDWRVTIEATSIDGFSFQVRRWDASPSPAFDVSYSINGGTDFSSSIGTIDNTFLGNSSDWSTFTYASAINSSGTNIIIKIAATGTTERIFIDNFTFDNPLPVELTSFTALAQSNTVNLTWETATEVNNYGFEIERTVVGTTHELSLQWAKVGFVEGHGNSNSAKQYSYVDNSVRAGQSYSYRLKQIDFDGQFEYSSVVNVEVGVPMEFSLAQNYPNPFNPSTSIEYSVPSNEFVILKVYDVLGNTVSTLVNETKEAGKYNVSFDASNLTSGIYFYSINAGGFTQVKKMMLVK